MYNEFFCVSHTYTTNINIFEVVNIIFETNETYTVDQLKYFFACHFIFDDIVSGKFSLKQIHLLLIRRQPSRTLRYKKLRTTNIILANSSSLTDCLAKFDEN